MEGSVFSIIPKTEPMLFYPSAIISPTRHVLKGITGHSLYLVGQCKYRSPIFIILLSIVIS